jgi:hypothetical protein
MIMGRRPLHSTRTATLTGLASSRPWACAQSLPSRLPASVTVQIGKTCYGAPAASTLAAAAAAAAARIATQRAAQQTAQDTAAEAAAAAAEAAAAATAARYKVSFNGMIRNALHFLAQSSDQK